VWKSRRIARQSSQVCKRPHHAGFQRSFQATSPAGGGPWRRTARHGLACRRKPARERATIRIHQQSLLVETTGPGFYEIAGEITAIVTAAAITTGLGTVFCRHTSASLLIQENADPDVRRDLLAFFRRLVPEGDRHFVHYLFELRIAPHRRTLVTSVIGI
jgi:secondary thiamine-phosphate synthase enzyme